MDGKKSEKPPRRGKNMDYRKSYRIFKIAVWGCLVLVLLARWIEILWMGIAGIVIMVLGMGQTVFFYKCPHCGSNFNIRAKPPKFCPECGKKLDD